ncbi:MAG TPA: ATP-binding protein [Pseudomonadota bacterium]|nr:ATP-binding protein [Pseudomonadota bacterium]
MTLRRLCLVGVSGLGKSTLLRAIAPRLPRYYCISGSTLLRELCGAEFPHFDHLPDVRKQAIREGVIRRMVQIQSERQLHILCDGHTMLRSRASGVIEPVFTAEDCAFYHELILLHAPASVVVARRQADTSRSRPTDEAMIQEELAAEAAESRRIAERHAMRFHQLDAADAALEAQFLQRLQET